MCTILYSKNRSCAVTTIVEINDIKNIQKSVVTMDAHI